MKTKFLLIIAAAGLMAWSCSDSCDDNGNSGIQPGSSRVVGTVAEVQNALNEGATTITLSNPLTSAASLNIPANYPVDATLSLNIPANNQNVNIGQSTAGSANYPNLVVDTDDANTVVINTPDMSVEYTGTAQTMQATTAASTLSITKGSSVVNLTINQGSLKLYGTVTNVTNRGSGKLYIAVGPATDRAISDDLIKNTLAVTWASGMILTEGKYPLNQNVPVTSTMNDANTQLWYMPIEKNGYEVIGEGDLSDIVVYGKEFKENGAWSTQNLVTVFASNVYFRNVTFKVKDMSNKTIEVLAENFKISNCAIVPNNEISLQNTAADGGSLYFNGSANNSINGAVVDSCYFNKATLSFDGINAGTITGTKNIFEGANYYGKVISTRNWNNVNVENSSMNVTLDLTEFKNIPEYSGSVADPNVGPFAAFTVDYGTIALTNAILPTVGRYWEVTANGVLKINNNTYTASNQ